MPRDVCQAVPDLHSFPNLKALLREDNTPLLASPDPAATCRFLLASVQDPRPVQGILSITDRQVCQRGHIAKSARLPSPAHQRGRYLRFAKQPWRIREFYRMLCPTADDRELEVHLRLLLSFQPCGRYVHVQTYGAPNFSSFTMYTRGESGSNLEVFEDWARSRGKKSAPVRPPSRGGLPALIRTLTPKVRSEGSIAARKCLCRERSNFNVPSLSGANVLR